MTFKWHWVDVFKKYEFKHFVLKLPIWKYKYKILNNMPIYKEGGGLAWSAFADEMVCLLNVLNTSLHVAYIFLSTTYHIRTEVNYSLVYICTLFAERRTSINNVIG